jgi:hypothetical protein
MNDSSRGIAGSCALGLIGVLAVGCSVVGFRYTYRGQEYTMTRPNSDYHQAAVRDVRARFGDPESQHEIAKLQGACELLNQYAAQAPDPGSFTPARDLLDAEAKSTCHQWHEREAAERTQADRQRREDEARRQQLTRIAHLRRREQGAARIGAVRFAGRCYVERALSAFVSDPRAIRETSSARSGVSGRAASPNPTTKRARSVTAVVST